MKSRALWQLNNQNRQFWDEPPLPEPAAGFASEPRPDGWEQVARWFEEATSGGEHRRRRPASPADEDIDRIARLVNEFGNLSCPPAETQAGIERGHRLRRAAGQLKAELSEYFDMAQPPPDHRLLSAGPAQTRLVDLWNALVLAQPYIGEPSSQGSQSQSWHFIARALRAPVAAALASAGRPRASIKADGPLVKIIKAIVGGEHSGNAIALSLKRHRGVAKDEA
jgi:hypothetical protein